MKSLSILGFITIILGIIFGIWFNLYWIIATIIGFPILTLGLVIGGNSKKSSVGGGPETVYCSNCGSVLTKGTAYCPYCGKKL
ncbi:MAG: zinc ribbon domain-containing protein [Candidatus Helarchaeota archaeon]